jgi:sporulation protein YlmC with PRC-barrel domain
MPITENELSGVYDGDVLSTSGEKIGSVGQIYLDDQTGEPTFVTANTGLFGMSQSFVPLRGARVENGNVVVDFDKTTVKDAPRINDDGSLSPAEEDQLYAYYGMGTTNLDTADYGTADQTPEPGFARADGENARSGESRLGDRTDDLRNDSSSGGRDVPSENRGDRPLGAGGGPAAAGPVSADDALAREGSGGYGAVGDASDTGDMTTPDAPPADAHRDWLAQARDRDAESSPTEDSAAAPSRSGRLRKWVMTEYEPVKSEEVYVEGSGQPGERPTR